MYEEPIQSVERVSQQYAHLGRVMPIMLSGCCRLQPVLQP